MDTDLKLGKFHTGLPSNRAWVLGEIASAAYNKDRDMMFASTVGFSTELRFLRYRPSYVHCCRALTLALAKLSCLSLLIVDLN